MKRWQVRQQVLDAIEQVVDKKTNRSCPKARMQAWQDISSLGVNIPWESFKRFWSESNAI